MAGQLKLYELAGADPDVRFSPHCWKTRMALAHKGLQAQGLPWRFNDKAQIAFTGQGLVPVLVHDTVWVHDSWRIACYLDEAFPECPALFDTPQAQALARFTNSWADRALLPAVAKIIIADIPDRLDAGDRHYFVESREQRLGSLAALQAARPAHLDALHRVLLPLRHTLREQPYLSGDTGPAYADYAVFGMFMWARCISPVELLREDDADVRAWRERLLDAHGGIGRAAPRADG
ncbi:glutathione S-transferase N-terminal domain-containing protein [Bordetella genomosp. 13]|uniref:glutathione S-transferase N-terminal domain-containing protein n=1 Tax=Bordetella genomosp. 13 TaxID=463040 RepID=UPI0011A973AD|nr:glutathione S-transferase N-terminal domain-containing protein [Bordetella genomosp. 13]